MSPGGRLEIPLVWGGLKLFRRLIEIYRHCWRETHLSFLLLMLVSMNLLYCSFLSSKNWEDGVKQGWKWEGHAVFTKDLQKHKNRLSEGSLLWFFSTNVGYMVSCGSQGIVFLPFSTKFEFFHLLCHLLKNFIQITLSRCRILGTLLLSPYIQFALFHLFLCCAILPSWNGLLSVNSKSFIIKHWFEFILKQYSWDNFLFWLLIFSYLSH
jgi:hypothetical protein